MKVYCISWSILLFVYLIIHRSLGGKLRIGLAEQSVLVSLAHAVVLTPPGQGYPPEILDAGRSLSSESLKKDMDEAALVIKTAYCELPTYNVIIAKLLEAGWNKLPETCHITPGTNFNVVIHSIFLLVCFSKRQKKCKCFQSLSYYLSK